LEKLPGIQKVILKYQDVDGRLYIQYQSSKIGKKKIFKAIEKLKYKAKEVKGAAWPKASK